MKQVLKLIKETGIWAPALVLISHQFLHVKSYTTLIDWMHHFSGGLSFSYFVWKSLPFFSRWGGTPTLLARLAVTFLAGCTAALLWEIAEFSSDLLLNTHIQKSVQETMMDIVNGFLGTNCTILAQSFLNLNKRRHSKTHSNTISQPTL